MLLMFQKYTKKKTWTLSYSSELSTAAIPGIPLPLPYHTECYTFVLYQHVNVAFGWYSIFSNRVVDTEKWGHVKKNILKVGLEPPISSKYCYN